MESNLENPNTETISKVLDKNYAKTANLKDQLVYKKHYLKEAAKLIKEMNITSNDLIGLSIDANSKGQQNNTFLLSDIVSLAKSKNKAINSELNSKISNLDNAFKGLDDRNYEISIYIPFAEKLNSKTSNSTSKLASEEDIYIFEQQDISEQLAFEGEILNEDGNWVTYDQLITEEMAEDFAEQGRIVAVIGLQDLSIYDENNNPQAGTGGFNPVSGGGSTPTTSNDSALTILDMAVKTHKESWIAGESELTIRGIRQYGTTVTGTNFLTSGVFHGGYPEFIFHEFKRKQVRNQNMLTLHRTVTYKINKNEIGTLFYVIYEADNWPANTYYASAGSNAPIRYYSSDPAYIINNVQYGIPSNGIYNTPYIENGEIKYRTYFN